MVTIGEGVFTNSLYIGHFWLSYTHKKEFTTFNVTRDWLKNFSVMRDLRKKKRKHRDA